MAILERGYDPLSREGIDTILQMLGKAEGINLDPSYT
jgi:hypothetical protein